MALTELQELADGAVRTLRWAELNEDWPLMEHLLVVIQDLGGHVISLPDPRYRWRNDYLVTFERNPVPPQQRNTE